MEEGKFEKLFIEAVKSGRPVDIRIGRSVIYIETYTITEYHTVNCIVNNQIIANLNLSDVAEVI